MGNDDRRMTLRLRYLLFCQVMWCYVLSLRRCIAG